MNYLLTFIVSFLTIYILYYIVVINRKKGLESFKKGKQLDFFIKTYKLDKKKLNIKSFANTLSLSNSFIIALTLTIIELIDNLILKLIATILLLVPQMIIIYSIIGKSYKKKEGI